MLRTGQVVVWANTRSIFPSLRTSVGLALQTFYHTAAGHSMHAITRWTIIGYALHISTAHL